MPRYHIEALDEGPFIAQLWNPISPTVNLPPLKNLSNYSPTQVVDALANLRALYFSSPLVESLRLRTNSKPYASAEEDEDLVSPLDDLRADEFERAFAIKWLIGFTSRSDLWMFSVPEPEIKAYTCAVDEAASDAPLLSEDHTSVGLQSWASSILLAERLCAHPRKFNLVAVTTRGVGLRVLELGAGTGLVSIAVARIAASGQCRTSPPFIVATDFHPDVLANFQRNVDANGNTQSIIVRELDWSRPNLGTIAYRPQNISDLLQIDDLRGYKY
ncbi:hypothetical protein F5148DRAFT_1279400 [Russula earlei]|uniref:Uncharacterized protein n=1 Tax=Russula earlei TaxID=71964 RepID=A0ACC0UPX4_9AGAM|nr:hypothetical protein F5148DRAFT_1279400 [Russula earlei]